MAKRQSKKPDSDAQASLPSNAPPPAEPPRPQSLPAKAQPTARNSQQAKIQKVRDLLARAQPQIELALPRWMDPERFARIAMTSVQLTPKLLECNPISLISAIMQCAQLGLEPDNILGHAYLVPFKQRVQIIVGYRGMIKLARNSKEVGAIEARAVYERDGFDFKYGDQGRRMLWHVPSEDDDPGALRGAYAICRFANGAEVFDVTLPRHVAKARAMAKGAGRSDSPWNLHEEEMWRKTAVRRLEPFLPLDTNARRAFAVDEAGERGAVQYIDLDIGSDSEQTVAETGLDALASEVEAAHGSG